MTDEFPCIELEKVAVRSVASQVLADRGARAEFSTETENSTEPSESPAIPVLSNIIIYRLGTEQKYTTLWGGFPDRD